MDEVVPTGERAEKDSDEPEAGGPTATVDEETGNVDGEPEAAEIVDSEELEAQDEVGTGSDRRVTIPMPNLADLALHSPSSLIGTPFSDVHSARFEYPFPELSSSPEMSSSPSPSASLQASTSQPTLAMNAPPALQHFPASFPAPSELPNYSPTHPKMRAVVPPPEPPSLTKRRQRWKLGLGSLSRKLSLRTQTGPATPSPESEGSSAHRRTMSEANGLAFTPATPDGT
ncbi:hypothetical protein C8F01DRAFT_1347745 [Mycena amicta]|nr:hypothetical protein C8F01DRAFT_1347745 [Mycena amicta]